MGSPGPRPVELVKRLGWSGPEQGTFLCSGARLTLLLCAVGVSAFLGASSPTLCIGICV